MMTGNQEIKPGKITWEVLREELMAMPKETLVEMVNIWAKNYWSNQGYWLISVERDFGFEEAARLDGEIWELMAKAQAHRLKKTLHLGNQVQDLAVVLKFCATQWVTAGFEWEFLEIGENKLLMQVNKCPMGTFRDSQNLPLLPCKLGAPGLYTALAQTVNPSFKVTCLHAHPDARLEGVMCKWEFILSK
ncbi:MAG: DUF6125 family protein [Bacillota bacterium]